MAIAASKVRSDPRDVVRCNTVTDVTRSRALIFTHPQTEEASVDFVSGPLRKGRYASAFRVRLWKIAIEAATVRISRFAKEALKGRRGEDQPCGWRTTDTGAQLMLQIRRIAQTTTPTTEYRRPNVPNDTGALLES